MKILFLFLFLPLLSYSQEGKENFKSEKTGDVYELIIRKPKDFDSTRFYNLIFFTDAGITSGKTILSEPEGVIKNCILIGIGHIGDWHTKRERDFISSDAGGHNDKDFGQASKFFLFMKEELIPFINKKFPKQKCRAFIGHSFGGLLALYMSLRENNLFDYYFAISPSVWANNYELLKIEKKYAETNKSYRSNLFLYAGSLEFLNKVLSSSKEFYNIVNARKYTGITIMHSVVSGVNHYGIVPKIIPGIFKQLK